MIDYGKIKAEMYKDGGSILYKYDNYVIIKFHTLDGNNDIYIVNKNCLTRRFKKLFLATMYDIINYRIEEVMYEKNINYICLFYSFRMQ